MAKRSVRRPRNTRPLPDPTGPVLLAEVVAEERVVARLEHLGATSASRARTLSGLSPVETAGLESLVRRRVVREGDRGTYYLDTRGLSTGNGKRVLAGLLFALLAGLTIALAVIGVLSALR